MHRIYGILNSGEWRIVYVRMWDNPAVCRKLGLESNKVGTVDFAEGVIFVDYRQDVLATVVHECIHIILEDRYAPGEEDANEGETQRLEKLVMDNMSRCQAMRLHAIVTGCLSYWRQR
jgi:hypothetical protein